MTDPEGFRTLRHPGFETFGTLRRYVCQPYAQVAFIPREIFLMNIYIRGWVDLRAIVRLEGLCQRKMPMTPSEIEAANFRLVTQCLKQQRHRVPPTLTVWINTIFNTNCFFGLTARSRWFLRSSRIYIMQRITVIPYRLFGTTSRSEPRKMGTLGCPETSVRNHNYTVCNIPEERSFQMDYMSKE